jgi:NAD(P)-dependent dehydrogenase (short-subunit alcohol dehydrogenase family)
MTSAKGELVDFSGKTVLITGAATGIGSAVAVGFASRGAKVAIDDINEEAARGTLDLLTRAGKSSTARSRARTNAHRDQKQEETE